MNKTFIILLGVISLYFLVVIWQDIRKIESLKALKNKLVVSLNYERSEKKILKNKIISLDNQEEVELAARRQLGMVKKGERAYKIIIKN